MNSASRPREGAARALLALWLALVALLPAAQPVWAAQPVSRPEVPAAQDDIQPDAPDTLNTPAAKTVVEHWIGTGHERDEAKQAIHNLIGDCWFCSFGVLERHFKVDLLVYNDGTLTGTITEELNLSYELTQNHCHARTGQIITARILNCTLVYPNPSATQVWQVKGLRTSEGDGRQYIEFESADTSQEYNFGGIVTGCEENWDGSCTPYFYSGEGLDVGLRDFDTLFPPSEKFVIDTTAYGRPAVVYDYQIETLNGYSFQGYHKYDYSWRLFEVGTRPILDLDQELLERSVFMNSVPLSNLFQAKVNWSAVGGGSTKWQVDASSQDTPVSPTTLIPRTFDVGALPVGSHPLRVDGRDTLGRSTNQENSDLVIAPLIKLCKELGYSVVKMGATANYKCSFRLPDPALEAEIKKMPDWFPYLGGQPFGIKETQVGIDLEVKSTGEGAIKGFGQTGFGAMGGSVIGSLAISGDVVLLPSGAKIPSGSMDVTLAGKLTKEQPLVAVVPQFAAAVTAVGKISPAAGAYLKDLAKLALEFEPKMVASPKFKNEDGGDVEWLNEEVTVGAGLKVVLSLTVIEDLVKLEASLGGEAQIVWTLPPNPNYFKSADAKIAATYKVQYWKFMLEGEKAYTWSYTGPGAMAAAATDIAALLEPTADPTWTLIDRAYVSQPDYAKWVGKAFTETMPADFALMTNTGPLVAPVLVEDFGTSTLIWSQERPGVAALGSDELAFARGTIDDWSAPAAYLTNDTVADWNPQAVARNGGTLLVW